MFDLQNVSKAIAGGLVGLIVALAARYGFHANTPTVDAVSVLVTAFTGYIIGHVLVYVAPKNKVTK